MLQTCRRHPPAGRFMATCPGCAQGLYDLQARNEAMAAARQALATIRTPDTARLADAQQTHRGFLIVITEDTAADFRFAIDVFRRPTAAEANPEQAEPVPADTWVLVDQWGACDAAEHAQQLAAARTEYAPRISLAA